MTIDGTNVIGGYSTSSELRLAGDTKPSDSKRVASKDTPRDVITAVIETANTSTPVKHRLGRKPSFLNVGVPMVSGRLYYSQDDFQKWTADTIYIRATAVGHYPLEVL